jgi:hypothetical protein
MKISEFQINEIERLYKSDFTGGKSSLFPGHSAKKYFELPGGSGLLYSIEGNNEPIIKLWDPNPPGEKNKPKKMGHEFTSEYETRLRAWEERRRTGKKEPQIIGKLSLEKPHIFPLKNALQVHTITVDEDYQGMGLAKAMYGIALAILKRPLLAGSSQTPGGRRNWVSLSQIPGVEMKGYIEIDEDAFTTRDPSKFGSSAKIVAQNNKAAEKQIDTIMGQLGGQYIGGKSGKHYFAFDVQPTTTGKELEAHVKQKLVNVYGNQTEFGGGLFAVWTGQQ